MPSQLVSLGTGAPGCDTNPAGCKARRLLVDGVYTFGHTPGLMETALFLTIAENVLKSVSTLSELATSPLSSEDLSHQGRRTVRTPVGSQSTRESDSRKGAHENEIQAVQTAGAGEHPHPRVWCPGVDIRGSRHHQCAFMPSSVTHLLDFHSVLDSVIKAVGATNMTQAQLPGVSGLVAGKRGFQMQSR